MKKEIELSVLKEIRDLLKGIIKSATVTIPINNRFEKLSDGWIKDKQLGIDWSPASLEKKLNWRDAEEYAKKFERQPTDIELSSLIDRSKYNPAIVAGAELLGLKTDDWYWSSTTCAWGSGFAWFVSFYHGYVDSYDKGNSDYVRPARSSQ